MSGPARGRGRLVGRGGVPYNRLELPVLAASSGDGAPVSARARILVLDSPPPGAAKGRAGGLAGELVPAASATQALLLLRAGPFDALYADLREEAALEQVRNLFRAEGILDALQDGVALV